MNNHKWYVSMTDRFLSGWGKAEGKINKLVIECESLAEAEIVYGNATARAEMKYVNINYAKPYYGSRYYISYHDKTDYGNWFKRGYFRK